MVRGGPLGAQRMLPTLADAGDWLALAATLATVCLRWLVLPTLGVYIAWLLLKFCNSKNMKIIFVEWRTLKETYVQQWTETGS